MTCVDTRTLVRNTHRVFFVFDVPDGISLLLVTRDFIWPATFILSATQFRCLPINGGHSTPSRIGRPPTGILRYQLWYLVSYRFLSLFVQRDSGIDGLFPFYLDGNKLYTNPKSLPTSVQLLLHNIVTIQYIPMPIKSLTQQVFSHFRLRTLILLGHIGGISLLWLSYVFALMRGKSPTCD